jgi:Flp pilus assembly protein TadD
MLKKLLGTMLVVTLAVVFTGCAEDEHKMTQKRETQTESTPQDTSPGTMTVE